MYSRTLQTTSDREDKCTPDKMSDIDKLSYDILNRLGRPGYVDGGIRLLIKLLTNYDNIESVGMKVTVKAFAIKYLILTLGINLEKLNNPALDSGIVNIILSIYENKLTKFDILNDTMYEFSYPENEHCLPVVMHSNLSVSERILNIRKFTREMNNSTVHQNLIGSDILIAAAIFIERFTYRLQ